MSFTPLQTARHLLACAGALVLQLEAIEAGTNVPPPTYETVLAEMAERVHGVLAQLTGRVNVRSIKLGVGVRDHWIAPALALLKSQGRADCVPGPRNAQFWAATTDAISTESRRDFGIAE